MMRALSRKAKVLCALLLTALLGGVQSYASDGETILYSPEKCMDMARNYYRERYGDLPPYARYSFDDAYTVRVVVYDLTAGREEIWDTYLIDDRNGYGSEAANSTGYSIDFSGYDSAASEGGTDALLDPAGTVLYSTDQLMLMSKNYYQSVYGDLPPQSSCSYDDAYNVRVQVYAKDGDHSTIWDTFIIDSRSGEGTDLATGAAVDFSPYERASSAPVSDVSIQSKSLSSTSSARYSEAECLNMVLNYYQAAFGVRPPKASAFYDDAHTLRVQLYESQDGWDSTWGWYLIDDSTGSGCEVTSGIPINFSSYSGYEAAPTAKQSSGMPEADSAGYGQENALSNDDWDEEDDIPDDDLPGNSDYDDDDDWDDDEDDDWDDDWDDDEDDDWDDDWDDDEDDADGIDDTGDLGEVASSIYDPEADPIALNAGASDFFNSAAEMLQNAYNGG